MARSTVQTSMNSTSLVLVAVCAVHNAQDGKFSGPSDVNPPVSEGDIRIVQRTREILNSPAKERSFYLNLRQEYEEVLPLFKPKELVEIEEEEDEDGDEERQD